LPTERSALINQPQASSGEQLQDAPIRCSLSDPHAFGNFTFADNDEPILAPLRGRD